MTTNSNSFPFESAAEREERLATLANKGWQVAADPATVAEREAIAYDILETVNYDDEHSKYMFARY